MPLQLRRGTDAERLSVTPVVGEPVYTTDTKKLFVGDGSTAGGVEFKSLDSAAATVLINSLKFDSADINAIVTAAGFLKADGSLDSAETTALFSTLLASSTTTDIAEGNNLYYTTVRADSDITSKVTKTFVDALLPEADTLDGQHGAYYLAYSNFTGTPSNVGDFTNNVGYITSANVLDSSETQTLIDASIAALVDTAPATLDTLNELAAALGDDPNFATTVTNSIAAKLDSSQTTALIDSAYVQARSPLQDFSYGSLTGAPTDVSSFANDANYLDSNTVTGVVDATYINSLVTATDSATVINIVTGTVDSAYVQARQTAQDFTYASLTGTPNVLDSADVTTLIEANSASVVVSGTAPASPAEGDLWYDNVTTGQLYTYVGSSWLSTAGLTTLEFSSIADLSDVDSAIPTDGQYLAWDTAGGKYIPTTLDAGTDSATVASIVTSTVDSAYVQARQTAQDFAYSSLTGTPTIPDSSTISAIITSDVDAAFINALTIDADTLGGNAGSHYLDYTNFTNTPNVLDSDNIKNIFSGGTGVTVTAGEIAIGQAVGVGDSVTFSGLTVSGNLTVTGTTYSVNTIAYTVNDPLLHLADSNENSDVVDIGFIAHYSDDGGSTKRHTGIFRDASNSQYYIFNGLVDAAFDSSAPTNIVNRDGTDFELAHLNVGTISGVYAGFDSDVTAAGLATQTYVTTTIDSDYINARVAAGTDSSTVVSIINTTVDSAYVNALVTPGATVSVSGTAPATPTEGDLWYDNVTTGQLYTYVGSSWLSTAGLTTLEFSSIADLSDIDSATPTDGQYLAWNNTTGQYVPTTLATGTDSATVASIVTSTVDSAYVQARQTAQDFAYASLTGAPTAVSSFTNDAGYITAASALDSAEAQSLIDASIAALVDTAPATLDTLNELAAALGDDANFSTTVTNAIAAKLDSAQTVALIDSSYVQARQTAQTPQDFAYSSLTGTPNILDSGNVISLIDSAYIQARQSPGTDSGAVIALVTGTVDSAYVNALVTPGATVSVSGTAPASPAEGDLWYDNVTTGQLYTYVGSSWLSTAGLTTLEFSSIADLSDVDSATPTNGQYLAWNGTKYVPTTLAAGTDSSTVAGIVTSTVDSAYVQALQTPQDFAYASLTGAPTAVSSFTNDAGYITASSALDSAAVITLVQANSASTTVDSAAPISPSEGDLWYDDVNTGQLYIYENSNWTATNVPPSYFDSNSAIGLIDSAYINARVAAGTDSSTVISLVQGVVDSAYVQARQTPQDFAYSSLTGAPNVLDSADVLLIAGGSGLDSAAVITLVHANSVSTTVDSAAPISPSEGDLWYDDVNTGQLYIYENSNWTATNVPPSYFDSNSAIGLIDSAYVQSRQTAQDFAYSSLTGAPNVLDSADVLLIAGSGGLDSAAVITLVHANSVSTTVDSAAPATPSEGDLWFDDTNSGQLYIYENSSWTSTSIPPAYIDSASVSAIITADVDAAFINALGISAGVDSAFVISQINSLVDAAPAALDTLNELAAALGDDANFSTTITNAIAAKLDSAQTLALVGPIPSSLTDLGISDGTVDQVLTTNGAGAFTFTTVSGGGGGLDSAAAASIIDDRLLLIDISDVVGADGNPGEVLQSEGNGNSSWVDMKLIARQKAFAMSLIFS